MEESAATELEIARRRIAALESELASRKHEQHASEIDLRFRQAVIEQAAEGVCVCHDIENFPHVQFTVWNRRMCEITGYTMEEINRSGWYQTLYPDPGVQQRARERMDRMRVGDDLRFERWEVRCADGVTRPIAISTSVLVTDDGAAYVLGLMHDLSVQEALREETRLARTDELTGARNRRGFETEAGALIDLAQQQRQPVTIAYLDVARFKALNDSKGHAAGDDALKMISAELVGSVRALDVVARIGGDEFAMLLLGMTAARATEFFGKLAERLEERSRGAGWDIGFHFGVVTFVGAVPALLDALTAADNAMYRAKRRHSSGSECVEVRAT